MDEKIAKILFYSALVIVCFNLFVAFPLKMKQRGVTFPRLVYNISPRTAVTLRIYEPSLGDVYKAMYNDFGLAKWLTKKRKLGLPFVMVTQDTTLEDLKWFEGRGVDFDNPAVIIFSSAYQIHPPIYSAVLYEHYDLLPFLLEKGANPSMPFIEVYNPREHFGKSYNELIKSSDSVHHWGIPLELLEDYKESLGYDVDKEISLIKKYIEIYDKKHPNWRDEWKIKEEPRVSVFR